MSARDMTPADLMRATELGKALVYSYVRGRIDQPREHALARIANALGVSAAWLMYGTANESIQTDNPLAVRKIPVLTLVAIGLNLGARGQLADLASGEFVPVGSDVGPRSACVLIEDEAVVPVLRPGDMAVIDPDAPLIPGKYVLAVVDNVAIVRRYRPLAGKGNAAELVAEHPDYPPIRINGTGRIVGRVVKRISDL